MIKRFKRIILFIMVFTIIIPILPIQVIADLQDRVFEEIESDKELLIEDVDVEGYYELPEGKTIILPILNEVESINHNMRKGLDFKLGNSDYPILYIPVDVDNSYRINGRFYLDTESEPESGGMLQILDDSDSIIASTFVYSSYEFDEAKESYYIKDSYFNLFKKTEVGNYSTQLVVKDKIITGLSEVQCVDDPMIASCYVSEYYVGMDEVEIQVELYGFYRESQIRSLTFSLVNEDNLVIAQSIGDYRNISLDSGYVRGNTRLTLVNDKTIESQGNYSLAITYSGEGTLVDGTGGMVGYIPVEQDQMDLEITNFYFTEPQTSKAKIEVKWLDTSKEYTITIRDSYSGDTYLTTTAYGSDFPLEVQLLNNGIEVPITFFNTPRFDVFINDGYTRNNETFENPYYNLRVEEHSRFSPRAINPDTMNLPFSLELRNYKRIYSGGTDFTIIVKDKDGEIIAQIHGNDINVKISRDESNYIITGILEFKRVLSKSEEYEVYFNDELIDTIFTTNQKKDMISIAGINYRESSFWTVLDKFHVDANILNTSGSGKLGLTNGDTSIASSPTLLGEESDIYGYKTYRYTFLPQDTEKLVSGESYSLVFIDNDEDYSLMNNYVFDGDSTLFGFDDLSFAFYDCKEGDKSVYVRLYSEARNITEVELNNLISSLILEDDLGNTIRFNDIASSIEDGKFESSTYVFSLSLSDSLMAGQYTMTSSIDEDYIRTFYIDEENAGIIIYGNKVTDGTIMGKNLPIDSLYKAKLYDGYTCLTDAPFPLIPGKSVNGKTQNLFISGEVWNEWDPGSYQLWIYMDNELLNVVDVMVKDSNHVIVQAYDPMNNNSNRSGSNLIIYSEYVAFKLISGNYREIRVSEDISELEDTKFTNISMKPSYLLSEGYGKKTLYVQLRNINKGKSEVIEIALWRQSSEDIIAEIIVDQNVHGVYNREEITFIVGSDTPLWNAYVDFINADGQVNTAQLSYGGMGNIPGTDAALYLFEGTFNTRQFNDANVGYLGYINDTVAVRFYLANKYKGELKSQVIERVLVFGELNNIIMPQFSSYEYITNKEDITLYGFATPLSRVTLTIGDDEALTNADEWGYFTVDLKGISEGEYYIRAVDDAGIQFGGRKLTVDYTAPVIEDLLVDVLDSNNIIVQWSCDDRDVDYFEIYKNNSLVKSIYIDKWDNDETEFLYNIIAKITDKIAVVAIDRAGNRGEKETAFFDTTAPTIPGKPTIVSRISTAINFTWTESTDNFALFSYDIFRDGIKVGSVDKSKNSYTDTGLIMNKSYIYKIKAIDAAGNVSDFSEEVELSTAKLEFVKEKTIIFNESYILEEPLDKRISVNATVFEDMYYNPEELRVVVQYKPVEEIWENCFESELLILDKRQFKGHWYVSGDSDGYLVPGDYDIRFKVTDEGSGEGFSDTQVVLLKWDDQVPTVSISSPKSSQTYGGKQINVRGNSTDNVQVDRIVLSYSIGGLYDEIHTIINDGVSSTFFSWDYNWLTTELPSGPISLKVEAYDRRGNKSEESISFVLDNVPPEIPNNFNVYGDDEKITVMWSYPDLDKENDFSHFRVYRSDKPDSEYACIKDNLYTIGYFDKGDTGVILEKTYYYYVTAVDIYGNESMGTEIGYARLGGDSQSPVIHYMSPNQNASLQKQAVINVASTDNYSLKECILEYSTDGDRWIEIATLKNEELTGYYMYSYIWDLTGLAPGIYHIKARVYDISGNPPATIIRMVSVVTMPDDIEKPIPVIGPKNLTMAEVNVPFWLTAAASEDNNKIASYRWEFGDGSIGSGKEISHIYQQAGNYTVTLTVTDASGNSAKATSVVTVIDLEENTSEYTRLNLNVCDAVNLQGIPNAEVSISGISGKEGFTDSLKSDGQGKLSLIVPNGDYIISVMAEDYIVRTISVAAYGKENGVDPTYTIGLSKGSILGGELTFTEMTREEIIAAGIDADHPDNNQVFKFALELEFVAGLETWSIPFTMYKNANDEMLAGYGGWGFITLGGSGGLRLGVFPISEKFILVIYGEARWLKEMYNVELLVINNSYTDIIEECTAELILPDGLSLAEMTSGAQDALKDLGSIGYDQTKTARWFVRGDEEGEYNLTAKVKALSQPYGEKIEQIYTTEKTLKVYAGSALKMTIFADDYAKRGEQYHVTFRLENVSHKPIYNLSFGITGIEQFKVIRMGNKEVTLPIGSQDFSDSMIRTVPEIEPGGYFEIEISTTTWFNSALELIVETSRFGAFFDVAYYLTNSSLVTLEGSTTEIPYEIVINPVKRPSFFRKVYESGKKLYGKDGDGEFDGSIGDAIIEIFLDELPMYISRGTKAMLSLQQGTTTTDLMISIDNGKWDGNRLYNENISITTGSEREIFYDNINGTRLNIKENGDFSIKGLKAGDTKVNFGIKGDMFNFEYNVPVIINDMEIFTTVNLNSSLQDGSFKLTSDLWHQAMKKIREEEKITYEENPFLWFTSYFGLNLVGTNEGLGFGLELNNEIIGDLIEETLISNFSLESDVVNLVFDRETLDSILKANTEGEAIKIFAKKLGEEIAREKFGVDRDTYELLIEIGDDVFSHFNGGEVDVSIPYKLKAGETAENIQVYRIKEDGSKVLLKSEYDSAKGLVNFTTDEFSYYQIDHKAVKPPQKDDDRDTDSNYEEERPKIIVKPKSDKKIIVTEDLIDEYTIYSLPISAIKLGGGGSTAANLTVEVLLDSMKVEVPIKGDGFVEVIIKNGDYIRRIFTLVEDGKILIDLIGGENEITIISVKKHPFVDVKISDWYYEHISYVYHYGLFSGTSNIEFNPNMPMTRGMIVTVLERCEDVHEAYSLEGFTDVSAEQWYSNGVAWALNKSIITGYGGGKFGPNDEVTREQLAVILYHYARYKNYDTNKHSDTSIFTDADSISSWAKPALEWAIAENLFKGKGNNILDPKGKTTRAEVAALLQRFIQNISK